MLLVGIQAQMKAMIFKVGKTSLHGRLGHQNIPISIFLHLALWYTYLAFVNIITKFQGMKALLNWKTSHQNLTVSLSLCSVLCYTNINFVKFIGWLAHHNLPTSFFLSLHLSLCYTIPAFVNSIPNFQYKKALLGWMTGTSKSSLLHFALFGHNNGTSDFLFLSIRNYLTLNV